MNIRKEKMRTDKYSSNFNGEILASGYYDFDEKPHINLDGINKKGDNKMEQYLIDEYGVIEDTKYLTSTDDIHIFISDMRGDLFDCGQGYYQDEAEVIFKIRDKFYSVQVEAEIGSAKQDIGDRLYWVDGIRNVTYKEIEKPQPKNKSLYCYTLELTNDQKKQLEKYMKEIKVKYD